MSVIKLHGYPPSSLLRETPVVLQHDSENRSLLVTVLSGEGLEMLFDSGWSRLEHILSDGLSGVEAHESLTSVPWRFMDSEAFNSLEIRQPPDLFAQDQFHEPRIVDRIYTDKEIRLVLYIPADLVWFEGHFPGEAILPAVVQIDWAVRYGCALGYDPRGFCGFDRLKFMAIVTPDEVLTLTLKSSDRGLEFSYESPGQVYSKGVILIDRSHECL